MMSSTGGLSPIHYSFINFWGALLSGTPLNPNFTDLIRLTEATLLSEPEPDQEQLKKLQWIYEHVDEEIDIDLPSLELMFLVQMRTNAGINKELEINHKTYLVIDIYKRLHRVNQQLVLIMMSIAKKYSLEIPMAAFGTGHNEPLKFG